MDNKPRKPWLAALLTLITIGLGHLYAGAVRRGLILFGLSLLLFVGVMAALLVLSASSGLALALAATLIFTLWCLADATRLARINRLSYELQRCNRWYSYLLFLLCASFIAKPLVAFLVRDNLVQAYKIPSGSMLPTLLVGDHILADKRVCKNEVPERGDIVIFPAPNNPGQDFIKRVTATAGDTVEIIAKQLYVNGRKTTEPWTTHADARILPANASPRDNFGPVTVPPDSVFLLGDNRDNAYDSRFGGFVRTGDIKGRARSVYWSWDREETRVRWERIGREFTQPAGKDFFAE